MSIKYPDVSVIIVTYNGGKYLESLFESLRLQSYPQENIEIIVVDNASADNTVDLIRKGYPHVKVVALDRNLGFGAGNNMGLEMAQHDYLVFLNQDTICHRHWLKGLILKMLEDGEIGACSSNVISIEEQEVNSIDTEAPVDFLHFYDLSPFGYGRYRKKSRTAIVFPKIVSGCSFAIRRKTVDHLGYLFDEKLWMYVEDTDLSLRIHNVGQRICVVRNSVVYHLHNGNTQIDKAGVFLAGKAIMNRVFVFFKNMDGFEFFLFFPFLFFGGAFKIFELSLSKYRKFLYLLPFSIFSMCCMIAALFRLGRFSEARRTVLKQRRLSRFPILRLVLKPGS